MLVTYDKGRFICKVPFASRHVPSEAGFTFDPTIKKWVTQKVSKAMGLRKFFDDTANGVVQPYLCKKLLWPHGIKVANGEVLDPYQEQSVLFSLTRNHSYLALEQGLGKTAVSLTVLNTLFHHNPSARALIIVPPFKFYDWFSIEIHRWVNHPRLSAFGISSSNDVLGFEWASDFNITVVSDTLIGDPKVNRFLTSTRYDLIIDDETHRFCNDTHRTKSLFGDGLETPGLIHRGDRVCLLSGTPMNNRPLELYPVLSRLAWNLINFMSPVQYGFKYCDGRVITIGFGRERFDFSGASHHETLSKETKPFMKVEKLDDHLNIETKHELIKLSPEKGLVSKKVTSLSKKFLSSDAIDAYIDNPNLGDIQRLRTEITRDKIKVSTPYVRDLLSQTSKQIILFTVHRVTTTSIYNAIKSRVKSAIFDGSISKVKKQEIKNQFQNGQVQVLVAQVETMVGIDLYKGSIGVFIETPWSPRAIEQAVSRLRRRGQTQKILIQHLVIAGTFEEYILRRVLEKLEDINKTIKKE